MIMSALNAVFAMLQWPYETQEMLAPHANSYLCNLFSHMPGLILSIQQLFALSYLHGTAHFKTHDSAFHA